MKVTILGSGTCVPSLERGSPSYLIETGQHSYLVDCGSGTLRQLLRAGKDYRHLDGVFITHGHPDHISDLMALLHALVGTPGFKRKKPLLIVAPQKVLDFYVDCILGMLRLRDFEVDTTVPRAKMMVEEYLLSSCRTLHSEDSYAYRFEAEGHSVVFTGDADYSDSLVMLATGADVLIADCSFPNDMKREGHMTPAECGRVAREAGVRTLVLSHIYPNRITDNRLVQQCETAFRGTILVARDLMEIIPP